MLTSSCRRLLSSRSTLPVANATRASGGINVVGVNQKDVVSAVSACTSSSRSFSSPPAKTEEEENAISIVLKRKQDMTKKDRHMAYGLINHADAVPAPVLPQEPKELSSVDPADLGHRLSVETGQERTVIIRQLKKSARQSPILCEKIWRIFFYEDGTVAETKWKNSLMGWTSNSDPYQCAPPLTFSNAAEAVHFCKKRGWKYLVKKPIMRKMRNDGAEYQDNFLPPRIAYQVKKEKTSCDYWHRTSAGTSHHFRPLNYHGTAPARQHGPNLGAEIAPHVPGKYKIR